FSQIGLLMVIGLAAKNAILIVEFAKVAYEGGMSLVDAALEGVRVRRRALFMTSFAFILGCVPLWTASGAGAVGRRILGTVVLGGALIAGCAIGPDYKRPAVAEPPTFRGQETPEAVSFADAPWWEVFQDPILKTLIQEALRNNYDAAIAAARVQEARANVGVA